MPPDMADEVDPDAPRPAVIQVAVEPQRAEVPLELALQERGGDAAPGVAGALGAEEDDGGVGAGAGAEGGGVYV